MNFKLHTLLTKDTTPIASVAESLLASISEIIESVSCIEIEQENFAEIGCYFYRASLVIMELQTTKNTPENLVTILQSLSGSIDVAKDVVNKIQRSANSNYDSELKSTISQLETLIKNMGECLSLIPSSTFQDQKFAQVAVLSLSNEMQNAHFEISPTQALPTKEQKPDTSLSELSTTLQTQEYSEISVRSLPSEMKSSQVLQTEELEPQKSFSEEELDENLARTETDFYSVNELSTEDSQILIMPHLIGSLESTSLSSQRKHDNRSSMSSTPLPQMAEYMEPLYETFCCPLTKQIMDDPVTLESGVTYERKAITEWFESSQEILCPSSGQKLLSRVLRTNVALKTTIEEWSERNEAATIKVCRAALCLASSASMVLEAINDLQGICRRKQYSKIQICNAGIIPWLVKLLEYEDRSVRVAALELLRQLAENDDGKVIIAKMMDLRTVINMLSSTYQPIKHAALLLLLEFSRSQLWCEKIGSVPGGILVLIRIKYNQSVDASSSEKADEILKNLETYPENIKHMAENGLLEPLLNRLTEGSEEIQMEMASHLGEIAIDNDSKIYVAESASPALIKMVHSGNTLTRRAAFKALVQISSYHPNTKILTEVGIVQIMIEEMFGRRIYDEPMNSTNEAATILANMFEAGLEPENLQVSTRCHKFSADYVLYNIIYMLKNSTPDELNLNLMRILICLTKSPKSMGTIFSMVKETEASYTLIELINNPHEELGVAAIKLLISLSPYMGHTLVERLCRTRGQPENLILDQNETIRITEKQAVSARFLAKLPHQNLTLNLALLGKNIVPTVLKTINQIQRTGTRSSRFASPYLEGLVGILVRFTTTLYEPQMLSLARNYNFTSVFTELLTKTSSDHVQRLSAIGLENLSSESVNLSKPPQKKRSKFLSFLSSKTGKIPVCPVHRGACSSQNTFCLVEANAVKRLLACLDHENTEVVEAAMSAICTLLDDKVDVDKSVGMLSEVNAIQHVLNVVKEHREEGLWLKSFWVIERFLMKGGDKSASDISGDRLFPAILVSAFHHGEGKTRQMAEKLLRQLNKIPSISTSSYTL